MTPSDDSKDTAYDFLKSFEEACTKAGLNFAVIFDYYFEREYVFKGPDYLLLGGPMPGDDETWHVFWAETSKPGRQSLQMIARFLDLMPYERPRVAWSRMVRGKMQTRYYLTARLRSLTARGQPVPRA